MLKYWFLGGVAATLAFFLTPLVATWAARLGAVDEPNERRVHAGRIPSLGGLAVLIAFLGALALGLIIDRLAISVFWGQTLPWVWLLGGALVVTACGTVDDIWPLGPLPKLAFQLVGGAMVVAGGFGITVVTNPLTGGSIALGWLGIPFTLLWVVGITNAFNLIDGLDGLAAGVALIAGGTLFVISLAAGRLEVALLAVTLAGALAGFLYHNFNPASVFLGDSGSLLLGYLLSVLSIQASQKGATAVVIVVPILALGLPIMDTLLTMLRRLLGALRVVRWDGERNAYRFLVGRASVFRPDRQHIHHRLLAMGLTQRHAVLLLYGVCIGLGVLAFLAVRARGSDFALLIGLVALATYLGIRKLAYQEVEVLRRGTLLPLFELPMLSRRGFHALVDAGFVAAAYAGSVLIANGPSLEAGARMRLAYSLLLVVAVKLGTFFLAGVYERAYRYTNAADMIAVGKALLLAQGASTLTVAVLYGLPHPAVVMLMLDFYLSATLVMGARLSFKILEVMARAPAGQEARPVLIYGAGLTGTALLRELNQNPDLGYKVVGFLDDRPALSGCRVNGVPVLGGSDALARILDNHTIWEIVIASPDIGAERVAGVAAACRARAIKLRRFRMALEEVETATLLEDEASPPVRRATGS